VQDAPFGLIGIANNIDPLVSSFGQLKRETGSTGAAFKALFSSLAGPAGIAIAVSAVTSALIAFGPQIKNLFNRTNELADANRKLRQEFEQTYADAAGKEIAQLQRLRSTIENLKNPQEVRLQAIKDLKKEFPTYFNQISNEALLAGKAGDAYKGLAEDIKAASRARAAEGTLAKIASDRLKLEEQRAKVIVATNREIRQAQAGGDSRTGTSVGNVAVGGIITVANKIEVIEKRRESTLAGIDKQLKQLANTEQFYSQVWMQLAERLRRLQPHSSRL
jgi:hypothetical protein